MEKWLRRVGSFPSPPSHMDLLECAPLTLPKVPEAALRPPLRRTPSTAFDVRVSQAELVKQLSDAAAGENVPLVAEASPSPVVAVKQVPIAVRSGAGVPARAVETRSPDPLMEINRVLNMAAPPVGGRTVGNGHGKAKESRGHDSSHGESAMRTMTSIGQAAPVPVELLVTSALRMHWPVERPKTSPVEAATFCREAAAALIEAAAQLSTAAKTLDGGEPKPDTKRRRTFNMGGHATSPTGVSTRSPPVRFSGLRV